MKKIKFKYFMKFLPTVSVKKLTNLIENVLDFPLPPYLVAGQHDHSLVEGHPIRTVTVKHVSGR